MHIYPGTLLDEGCGQRILKCYIYKFAKKRILRKPRYDPLTKMKTGKKFLFFNTIRPIWGEFHVKENLINMHDIHNINFIESEENIFFIPQYYLQQDKKRKSYVFLASGKEVLAYFKKWDESDLQNITVFNSKFSWVLDVFEDTTNNPVDNMDVVAYFYHK